MDARCIRIPHDGVPFEFEGQPPETTHTFRSDAFHWAPDSSAVVFADSIMDKLLDGLVVQIQPEKSFDSCPSSGCFRLIRSADGRQRGLPNTHVERGCFWKRRHPGRQFPSRRLLQICTDDLGPGRLQSATPEVPRPSQRGSGTLDGVEFK